MTIALSIILYSLNKKYRTCINDSLASFDSVNLIQQDIALLKEDTLYVGRLSDYLNFTKTPKNVCFLCMDDADEKVNEKDFQNLVILEDCHDLCGLFNDVINIFFEFEKWTGRMQTAISQNKGLQDLIDISEAMLGNHIDILDGSFKLLAYTKRIESEDPVTNTLIETGAHPKDLVEKFYKDKKIAEFENASDIIIGNDSKFTSYPVAIKVFHINEVSELYVVMICNNNEPTRGFIDLYRIFLGFIERFCVRSAKLAENFGELYDLCSDLLEQKVSSKEEVAKRLAFTNYPSEKGFVCMTVKFEDEINVISNRIVGLINRNLYSCTALPFKKRVVLIHFCNEGDDSIHKVCERVKAIIAPMKCHIGVSNVFSDLWDLGRAYEQTMCVLECAIKGNMISFEKKEEERDNIYRFEDYFMNIFLFKSGINSSIFKNSFMVKSMDILERASVDRGFDLIKFLDVYFASSCKATEAGNRLHMHRNSVLYHISKIENILGESLDDPDVCLKLELAIIAKKTGLMQLT